MARLVMKFGGTSVANIDRIRNSARHVKREVDAGQRNRRRRLRHVRQDQ
jgi:aspartokinase